MVDPEDYFGERDYDAVALEYFIQRLTFLCQHYHDMEVKETQVEENHGWQGVFEFRLEDWDEDYEGIEYLHCFKPECGPFVDLSLGLRLEDQVFKQHVKEIIDIISSFCVSPALLYQVEGLAANEVHLQLSMRVFTETFSSEGFEFVVMNLIFCKGKLLSYLAELGVEF